MTLFPFFFRQCLWLNLGLGCQTASQAILLSPALTALGSLVLEGPYVAFYKDSSDSNSGPPVCAKNTLTH